MFIRSTWVQAFSWASFQAEEQFCDFFALRLFGESYLHAFAYLLAPGDSGTRSLQYPAITRRVKHLQEAATALNIQVPADFAAGFGVEKEPVEPATKMLVAIADDVSEALAPRLIDAAKNIAHAKKVPEGNAGNVSQIAANFVRIIPAGAPQSLSDIVNAGWFCQLMPDLWSKVPQIRTEDKHRILRDLILKSMEVSEVYTRIGKTP